MFQSSNGAPTFSKIIILPPSCVLVYWLRVLIIGVFICLLGYFSVSLLLCLSVCVHGFCFIVFVLGCFFGFFFVGLFVCFFFCAMVMVSIFCLFVFFCLFIFCFMFIALNFLWGWFFVCL